VGVTLLIVLTGLAVQALAQAEKPPPLDEELLKQLRADPIDDVDRELFGPDQENPPAEGEDLRKKLTRELGDAAVSEDENPLLSIAERMRESEALIAQTRSDEATQSVQKRIVADLEKLIEEARKRCCKGGSPKAQSQATAARPKISQPCAKPGTGEGKPQQKPAVTSNAKPGQTAAAKPDLQEVRTMIEKEVWGSLPQRQRQQLLQLPIEEFLPKYEQLIIEYFKRLSEERRKEGG
jgi:hypothetical protein